MARGASINGMGLLVTLSSAFALLTAEPVIAAGNLRAVSPRPAPDHISRFLQTEEGRQCTFPENAPCTTSFTTIGMLERGLGAFYDRSCTLENNPEVSGCRLQDVLVCRTCFLDVDLWRLKTNTSEEDTPGWYPCPCCTVPTLQSGGSEDIEVINFDYSTLEFSEKDCTDMPTLAPVPTPGPSQAPTLSPTRALTAAPTLAPSVKATDLISNTTVDNPDREIEDDIGGATEAGSAGDEDNSLSDGAKIGIGVGAAVIVSLGVGAVFFGLRRKGST